MKTICKKYCFYYKEDKKGEKGCLPLQVANVRGLIVFATGAYDFKNCYEQLKQIFCERCDYYHGDCDFHNKECPGPPCGGYIYFEDLISKGFLTIDEVRRLCETFK
jgi:hypothetical protein